MILKILCWVATLLIAFLAGKAVSKLKLPAILGWLITGMILGPNAVRLLPQDVLDTAWYKTIIMWMQCSFGLMLGTELVWKRMKNYGKALMVTTLTQSLGYICSCVPGICYRFSLYEYSGLPGFCFRRNRSGNRTGTGFIHRQRVSHKRTRYQYSASYGCTG